MSLLPLDESLIPAGPYCYSRDENGEPVNCPYWSKTGTVAYCAFLDMESEDEDLSLLWDAVKACGINDEDEDEENL